MISASPDVTQCVKDTVVSSWNPGIQDEKEKFGCWSFKLRGTPWYTEGTVGVNARMLMTKILEALLARGWIVQTGIHTKRKTTDKCVLMFQRSSIPPCQILCLSMCSADKLRLIGAPQNVVDVFRDIVTNKWCFGASRETTYDDKGYGYELKLNENPWKFGVIGHDGAHARTLLMFLLRAFAQLGWRILLSADVSARYDTDDDDNEYPYDVHSWWFINDLANPQQNQQTQFGFGYQYGSSLLTGPPPSAPPPSYDTATKNW